MDFTTEVSRVYHRLANTQVVRRDLENTTYEGRSSYLRLLLTFVEQHVARRSASLIVCIVLSSSSIPRVGMRAAVRRLHRTDLVREMAGMLDEEHEDEEDEDEDEEEDEDEDEEDEDEEE